VSWQLTCGPGVFTGVLGILTGALEVLLVSWGVSWFPGNFTGTLGC